MSCEFGHYDGAYVLGALSAAERDAFEEHLAHCAGCARGVRELAGLPGLLARVDLQEIEAAQLDEPVPSILLPALIDRVRRDRRRRLFAIVGTAAAAVVATVVLATSGLLGGTGTPAARPSPSATAVVGQPMSPLGDGPLSARVGLVSVSWGTRLMLTCSYGTQYDWQPSGSGQYVLVVRTRDGSEQQLASWRAVPGKTVSLTATTGSPRRDIGAVEVRTAAGRTVLRLTT